MQLILDSVRAASEAAPLRTTMLSLVTRLHDEIEDADEVARTAAEWIRTGRVVLTGNFKGRRDFEVD